MPYDPDDDRVTIWCDIRDFHDIMECDEEALVLTLVAKPEVELMSGEIEISLDDGVNNVVSITISILI